MHRILLVEDEESIREAVKLNLELEGYEVVATGSSREALAIVQEQRFDLLLLDVMLPEVSGFEICEQVRLTDREVPILFLTAKDGAMDRVQGLKLGADDYLTKPFDTAELIARIRALIRRRNFAGNQTIRFGQLFIHPESREVFSGETRIDLTRSEYDLLLFFLSNPKRVLSRQALAEHIWGDNSDLADSFDFIYSHIKNLRKKIMATGAPDPIKAVYGIGYKLAAL